MRILVAASLFVLALGTGALAGPKVPDVSPGEFPVAGTCATLPTKNVTWVTVGEEGFYRIDGDLRDIDGRELATVIKARGMFASQAGDAHDVWIITRADRSWERIVNVLGACQEGGIHRVGLQVRSETDNTTYGFPLFLPHGTAVGVAAGDAEEGGGRGRARRLGVRLNVGSEKPSDPHRLYAAAQTAVEQFGPIVAEVSVSVRTTVQDAVTAIDMLYRAGCSAVRLKYRMMVRGLLGAPKSQIWVEERLLGSDPIDLEIPPVRPITSPWTDDGAAEAGAHRFLLEPIPSGRPHADEAKERLHPLPSYAAIGGEVPPEVVGDAVAGLKQWSAAFGGWLGRIITQTRVSVPETLLVKRRRQGEGVQKLFAGARAAFGDAKDVRHATLRVQAYLLRDRKAVGKVDATLSFAGPSVELLFAQWVVEATADDLVLPPRETEPYAAGVPGELRVFLEAVLAVLRARGGQGIRLALESDVLSELPAVAHAGARRAIGRRQPAIDALAGWLQQTPYDRVFIVLASGQAGVHGPDGTVVGVLRYDLEGELGNLSMASLTVRAAPR